MLTVLCSVNVVNKTTHRLLLKLFFRRISKIKNDIPFFGCQYFIWTVFVESDSIQFTINTSTLVKTNFFFISNDFFFDESFFFYVFFLLFSFSIVYQLSPIVHIQIYLLYIHNQLKFPFYNDTLFIFPTISPFQ